MTATICHAQVGHLRLTEASTQELATEIKELQTMLSGMTVKSQTDSVNVNSTQLGKPTITVSAEESSELKSLKKEVKRLRKRVGVMSTH